MTVRFLHTGDWQLGMTRQFLDADAQARFSEARFDAIRTLGRIAREHACAFVVVAGDVFESNYVEPRTVLRAFEALETIELPVYLLPGNHDPLDPASIFDRPTFQSGCPGHVHVIRNDEAIPVLPGVELIGLPWTSKRPAVDLVAARIAMMAPQPANQTRILVAHGPVDEVVKVQKHPATIHLATLEAATRDGRVHYTALGDRHAPLAVGSTERIWYAGAPEPTDFDEDPQGRALVVDVDDRTVDVASVEVGTWRFRREAFALSGPADVARLGHWLDSLAHKSRTIARIELSGRIDLAVAAALEHAVEGLRPAFAAVDRHTSELVVAPAQTDVDSLGLAGFARTAAESLREEALGGSDVARDALSLLLQLAEPRA